MPPELFTLLINAGGFGAVIWMLWEMKKEAASDRKQLWELTVYLVKRDDPSFDSQIVKLPSDKSTS